MKWSVRHYQLQPHQKYQLEVILLFVFGFFLYIPYFIVMEEFGLEKQVWQWYFFWPWAALYIGYSFFTRRRIRPDERVSPLKRPVGHWALLGITLIAFHLQPGNLEHLQSIDLMFAVFSIFLADSYWDFTKNRIRPRT